MGALHSKTQAGDIKSPLEGSPRLKRYQAVRVAEEVKIIGERVTELGSTTLPISFSYKPVSGLLF